MKCFKCGSFCIGVFCKNCKRILSEFSLNFRVIDGIRIYYFYPYSEIKELIYSKHKIYGSFVFNALAKLTFKEFAKKFELKKDFINAIPLDDRIDPFYSHSAILANALRSKNIKPIFNALKARSDFKYFNKTLEQRVNNPRNFILSKKINNPIILVDDVITSGLSMKDAINACKKEQNFVLFGLTLANAKE